MFDDVAKLLTNPGAVGVIPTDTVYGVVARASDQKAVARLYELKSRERKPGTVIAANIDQLVELGVKRRYLKAVEEFWPAAVSVELPFDVDYLTQSTGHLAFRIPDNEDLIKLLLQTDPLLTASANRPGETTASTVAEAKSYFGDRVDFYIDGGDLSHLLPPTVIRIVDDAIEILRQGAVIIKENER